MKITHLNEVETAPVETIVNLEPWTDDWIIEKRQAVINARAQHVESCAMRETLTAAVEALSQEIKRLSKN